VGSIRQLPKMLVVWMGPGQLVGLSLTG
jgi:hypothetical protein